MAKDYKAYMADISKQIGALKKDIPDTIGGFYAMAGAADKAGALDPKTKEYVALGIAVAIHCEPCVAFHTRALVKLGVTRQEFEEVLGTAIYMGGGPSLMYSAHAMEVFEQLTAS